MGPGLWFYTQSGCLNNQPSQWGIILNFPIGRGSEVHQIWFEQSSGKVMHRGGNGSGWNGTWKYFSPGTATAAQVLSGYTFSSADGSNLSGSMVNRGALNWSGSNTTYTVPAGYYSGGTLNSKTSYTNGYNAGVTAADNRANTSSTNYKTGYNAGYSAGTAAKASKIWTGHINTTSGGSFTTGFQPHIILIQRDGDNFPIGVYCSYGISVNHIEGPSNSHYSNIFSTNSNGFSLGTLNSYTKDKYCYCAAVRIV